MGQHSPILWLMFALGLAQAQEESSCYGSGSIALSVILSIIFTTAVLMGLCYLWRKHRMRKDLILETDPEKGKAEYAFDNPGFKDPGLTPIAKLEANKTKWTQWSPLSALTTKSEIKKTLDDSTIDGNPVKVVALRSHDFTGLGFNICGNMKEGIYIKDILHRGPASESGKLNTGDRISNVTISFEHMVYEDALTILSYASPYEVIIEARGGKIIHQSYGQGAQPSHPIYRSSSCIDLMQIGSASNRRLFVPDDRTGSVNSSYSSLQKSRSNMTTLERKESHSPKGLPTKPKKMNSKALSPEQLKHQLEQKILSDHQHNLKVKNENLPKVETEIQKTDNKLQKFGIRVLPSEKRLRSAELSQNDNNINLEKQPFGTEELDDKRPVVKKRERKMSPPEKLEENFIRDSITNSSGIKRDANGIPQEIPNYMMNAAVIARSNRRGSDDQEDTDKTPKKTKGKAPAPPEERPKELFLRNNLDEIQPVNDEIEELVPKTITDHLEEEIEIELGAKNNIKDYNSDSDLETDNQSSVNTIELNSSDITIHHAEENDDRQNRRTASTGDLTKIQRTRKSSNGTLERAQSLDITDIGIQTLTKKRKAGKIEDDMGSQEDIFGKAMITKEPRLSLILDGLNTFQRNRLKKSTEWGNLEDAILKLNQEDESHSSSNQNMCLEDAKFNSIEEFDALVNKINEIKRESMDVSVLVKEESVTPVISEKKRKNQIWPFSSELNSTKSNGITITKEFDEVDNAPIIITEKKERNPPTLEPEESVLPPENVVIEKKFTVPITTEKKITKPAIPEKKDFLLSSLMKVNPSYVPEQKTTPITKTEFFNKSDEIKTQDIHSIQDAVYMDLVDLTGNFIFREKISCSQNDDDYRTDDTNISDDIKVSRHSIGSLERPKSDDAKMNVSNVTVNNDENLHSLEGNVNEFSGMYTPELDNTVKPDHDSSKVTISTPDIIKNATITEAINKLNNDVMIQGPSSLTLEISCEPGTKTNQFKESPDLMNYEDEINENTSKNSSLTYITEIQVLTPNNSNSTNVSEIKIIPNTNSSNCQNLNYEFENYVRNFESNVKNFESNIQKFENRLESPPKPDTKGMTIADNEAEKELHKIQEIAEEQLKKLPEMRFTTSSYEAPKTPDKRTQIELLRSNFEKNSPKVTKGETTPKSRIPIATTAKTPPTSPERRDSHNLDIENDKDILELMSSTVHSTPLVSQSKYQIKPSNKNVTITSIRTNSKIPSGLPILSVGNRPPVTVRKQDDDHVVQVTTNGGMESSFKQWVFNPADNSVTNIVVAESKQQK